MDNKIYLDLVRALSTKKFESFIDMENFLRVTSINLAFAASNNNSTEAAKLLGLNRTTFLMRCRRYKKDIIKKEL